MPRSRSSGGGASRPSAPMRPSVPAPAPRAPQQQQTRPMSNTAHPPATQAPPAQAASGGSGLFGQMASTAAGVAVGSSIGHAIGGFFGGGSSNTAQAPAQDQYQQPIDSYAQPGQAMDSNLYNASSTSSGGAQASGPCANDIRSFTGCMEQNRGDLNICGWYLEQLKACQSAARQY